jgi:hypothetical protein
MEGNFRFRQAIVRANGRKVEFGRVFHVQGLMWPLLLEDADELIEPGLLTQ